MRQNTVRSAAAAHPSVGSDPFSPLFAPLDFLLAGGGDTRLTLDPETQLNTYGCRPYPRPEAFTFASSTATSISERGYDAAAAARASLIDTAVLREDAFHLRMETLRLRLAHVLKLEGTGIVFSPSGTDAQLQALFAARAVMPGPMTAIVVAADETGSGAGFAVSGRHFNAVTALGHDVTKGAALPGLSEELERIDIPANDPDGRARDLDEIDHDVLTATRKAVAAGRKVLLVAMDRSKLWRRAPSLACLADIAARWPADTQLILDACQLRLSPARIAAHLALGAMVLVTGSKFFTGPPFSGALLVPERLSQALAGFDAVPQMLGAYTNRADWPAHWRALRGRLPDGFNAGQWLRWEAALAEMEAYRNVPQTFRSHALADFMADARARIVAAGLALVEEEPRDASDTIDDGEFTPRTILPFFLHRNSEALSRPAVAGIYRALNCDVTARLPPGASAADRQVAAQLCHIGQPVAVRDGAGCETAVLRISAGARILSDSWAGDETVSCARLAGECEQVDIILRKIALLLRHGITV